MADGGQAGLLDLEKELTCSVSGVLSKLLRFLGLIRKDMHRDSLSTFDVAELPAHFLWFVLEGMVLMASFPGLGLEAPSVYLSIMSSHGARNEAKRYRHHTTGHVLASQSREGKNPGGEG